MLSKLEYFRFSLLFLLLVFPWTSVSASEVLEVRRLTTTILVEDVDACAAFWTERLGFQQTIAVPSQEPGIEGNQFIAVASDRHELMFQSIDSAESELPGMYAVTEKSSFLMYLEVSDLDAAIERMEGVKPAISRRTTFYDSEEIGYHDPCGTLVVLAEFPEIPENDSSEAGSERDDEQ